MKILIFGISNVGKTTCGELLSKKLGYTFFDLDEEIRKYYNTTLEDFVSSSNLLERDKKRGIVAENIVIGNDDIVFSISPITYLDYFDNVLNNPEVLAIELTDTVENVFNRLVFSDENDEIYEDREYCEKNKDYYMRDLYEDLIWYGKVYKKIENKYFMDGKTPQEVVDDLIFHFQLNKRK